jgi:transketolase
MRKVRTAFIQTLCELAATDQRIWLLTGDVGYSVLEGFRDTYPDRYVNVGVAEQNMTGIAAGLASSGKIVFTYSIANFPTLRCLEQIRNDICYHQLPVRVVAVGGGFAYGPQGYTHHGTEDLAIMRALPSMTVVAPGDPVETRLATRALVSLPGPAYLRLGKSQEPVVYAAPPDFTIGKAIQLRGGGDATLISTGAMLAHTLDVADQLASQEGLRARVLSMHTLKPLDVEAVRSAACETGGIVTVEEHSVTGGLGSAVADVLAAMDRPRCALRKFGAPDGLQDRIGSQAFLRRMCGDLRTLVRDCLKRPPP